jgi:riboflavin kinase / FMN adenylyltransferase
MQTFYTLEGLSLTASACALGMFDGIHVGHQMVLETALKEARVKNIPGVVVSFTNHPQVLISQTPTLLLSSTRERLKMFEEMGFDIVVLLEFNAWLKNLSAETFVSQILLWHLGVKSVTVGYDYRFGNNRSGDGLVLSKSGQAFGFTVQIIEPVRVLTTPGRKGYGQIVSSTLIRKLLSYGDVALAAQLLGMAYQLPGTVVHGLARGRKIGFPTANLAVAEGRLIPQSATYGGKAQLNGVWYPAVCNIGTCPTFSDDNPHQRVEVHLLNYQGDLFYDVALTMQFLYKIRDEQKFDSVAALKNQITLDCQYTLEQLALPPLLEA